MRLSAINRRMLALLCGLLLMVCTICVPKTAMADGTVDFQVYVSAEEVQPGEEFNVIVSASSDQTMHNLTFVLKYDPTLIAIRDGEGNDFGGTLKWVTGDVGSAKYSEYFKATALVDSTANVTFESLPVAEGMSATMGNGATVKIGNGNAAAGQPTDVTVVIPGSSEAETEPETEGETYEAGQLSELTINPGELTFDPAELEYSVRVPAGTTRVAVSAVAGNADDQFVVSGYENLKDGANLVTVTVTAADGSVTEYKIHVIVGDVTFYDSFSYTEAEKTYTVKDFEHKEAVPAGFTEETVVSIDGKEMRAYANPSLKNPNLKLVCAELDGKTGLYWYDEETASLFPYIQTGDPNANAKLVEVQSAYSAMAENYNNNMTFRLYIIGILALAGLILLIVTIMQMFKIHGLEKQMENDRVTGKKSSRKKEAPAKETGKKPAKKKAKKPAEKVISAEEIDEPIEMPEETPAEAPVFAEDEVLEPESMVNTDELSAAILAAMDNTGVLTPAASEQSEVPTAQTTAIPVIESEEESFADQLTAAFEAVEAETEVEPIEEAAIEVTDETREIPVPVYEEEVDLYQEPEEEPAAEEPVPAAEENPIPEIPNFGEDFALPVEEPLDPEPETPVYRRPLRERPQRPGRDRRR